MTRAYVRPHDRRRARGAAARRAPAATAATRNEMAAVRGEGRRARAPGHARAACMQDSPRRVGLTARVPRRRPAPRDSSCGAHGTVVLRADLGRPRAPARRARISATASRFSGALRDRRRQAPRAPPSTPRAPCCASLPASASSSPSPTTASRSSSPGSPRRRSRYRPVEGARGWLQRLTKGYEGKYQAVTLDDAPQEIGYPALLADRRDTYTLLTETGVPYGQPGEHLRPRRPRARHGARQGHACARPRAGASRSSARSPTSSPPTSPTTSPRRRGSPTGSWIRPGRVAWSWWADSWSPTRLDGPARATSTSRARMGFECVLVDAAGTPAGSPTSSRTPPGAACRCCCGPTGARSPPRPSAPPVDQWAAWGVAGVKADILQSDRERWP